MGVVSAGLSLAAEHRDVVDASKRFQVIENFGASDCWTMQEVGTWSDANRNRVADLLFSCEQGIGLSLWRFNIGAGKEPHQHNITDPLRSAECFEIAPGQYDWTRQAGEQWFLKAAKDRGVEQFLAFVNSPPARMTRNGLTNLATDERSPTNLKPGLEGEFARFVTDVLTHFRDAGVGGDPKYRIHFGYVSPINEPNVSWNGTKQEGNRADNMTIRRVIRALHKELAAQGMKSEILAPESTNIADMVGPATRFSGQYGAQYGDYVDELAGDETIAPLLSNRLCYHLYHTGKGQELIDHSKRIAEKMAQYPGWKSWMSEVCIMEHRRDLGMSAALDLARLIHGTLSVAGASAFHWWLAMSTVDYKDGLIYSDWRRPGDPESVLESKMLWAMGNYSRFIRPGFVRVELAEDNHSLETVSGSAYVDPETGRLVIVYINAAAEPQQVWVSVKGKAIQKMSGWLTSERRSLDPMEGLDASQGVTLPARSVVTLVID